MKITGNILIFFILMLFISKMGFSQEVLQWRGSDRTGKFSETGLLKEWPETGPNLLWESPNIGNGFGSPIITNKNIYVNGEVDSIGYLFCLDLTGKEIWRSKIGPDWVVNYPGARTTPTLAGNMLYTGTGMGIIACVDALTGKTKWTRNMIKDFHGRNTRFGYSESFIVDGNKVFCMPGGQDTNFVALDINTGNIIWICKGLGQLPSYCSPLLIQLRDKKILVSFSKSALLGIDSKDGKLLWSQKQEGEGDVHVNTPLFENGFIYYITGDGNGGVKLKLSEDGSEITQVWANKASDGVMGGFIRIEDHIYSSSYERRNYYIEDEKTGVLVDSVKFDKGTINSADGMLYLYNEKGQLGLFKPEGKKLEMVSSFKVTKGTKAHFAHPVICKGILYIRHGKSLLAYDIKSK